MIGATASVGLHGLGNIRLSYDTLYNSITSFGSATVIAPGSILHYFLAIDNYRHGTYDAHCSFATIRTNSDINIRSDAVCIFGHRSGEGEQRNNRNEGEQQRQQSFCLFHVYDSSLFENNLYRALPQSFTTVATSLYSPSRNTAIDGYTIACRNGGVKHTCRNARKSYNIAEN